MHRSLFGLPFSFKTAIVLGAGAVAVIIAVSATMITRGQTGGMAAMSVDMDTTGNSATALGADDPCVQAAAGTDVILDITANSIPASNPMIGYTYTLHYDSTALSVTAQNPNFLLASTSGSNLLNASDSVPDSDGSFVASVVDVSTSAPESG